MGYLGQRPTIGRFLDEHVPNTLSKSAGQHPQAAVTALN
jgi:hypothetical protein